MPGKGKGGKKPPQQGGGKQAQAPPAYPIKAGFLPPGANAPMGNAPSAQHQPKNCFGYGFDRHFHVPNRISKCPTQLIEAVNDFHYAMMNDTPRNEFYYEALKSKVTPESGVVEIGAGSGLLSMMAAKLGAKWVVAVEGSAEMAAQARQNIKANGFEKQITVLNLLSTDLQLTHLPGKPDVMVSEIFGTLLLGESALDYIADMRNRLLPPGTPIVPRLGTQYAVLIECPVLEQICAVKEWNGINMSHVNALKDTSSCVFTKKYGFRMSSMPYEVLCEPIEVGAIDFMKDEPGCIPLERDINVKITRSGTAHAMLLYWKAFDGDLVMSTDPRDTLDNFPRDMQWGQALQLLDAGNGPAPEDVIVTAGETRVVNCCTSDDSVIVQFNMTNPTPQPEATGAASAKKE